MSIAARMLAGALALSSSLWAAHALAQDNFPSQPIRLVVGFAPGGSSDATARLLAQKLSTQMNANVVVLNRDGANTAIAAELVANSKPDGYTLLVSTPSQVLSPALGDKLSYDVFKDFTSVSMVATAPPILVVNPAIPANTAAEFISHLKANPGKLSYGSAGVGSIIHLSALLFCQANGVSALHVPYKSGSQAVTDLVGGQIQFSMQSAPAVVPMLRDKRLKALGIAGLRRSPLLPEVPTLAETIMPGFEIGSWYGLMGPANMPPAILRRLNSEIVKAMQDAELKTKFAQQGLDSIAGTPEEAAAYLRSESERWTKVVKNAGGTIK